MADEVPEYDRLQNAAIAASGHDATRVLEVGTGTGQAARRVLAPGWFRTVRS
jgi:spermidine synthase